MAFEGFVAGRIGAIGVVGGRGADAVDRGVFFRLRGVIHDICSAGLAD